ncbi:MAG: hypothetical protein JW797_08730 [Bradymonadales bacterium]|nr:hypothetical protein [Bradymonadales bacterium]
MKQDNSNQWPVQVNQDQLLAAAEKRGHLRETKGAGIGAATGAMVGSFFGPVGALIGGGLGGAIGYVLGKGGDKPAG